MATYIEIFNLRFESTNLRTRAVVAVAKAAQDILNEDPSTTNHTARIAWARQALQDTARTADAMLWGLVGNATIQANGEASPDGDIQFVINSLVDQFAAGV